MQAAGARERAGPEERELGGTQTGGQGSSAPRGHWGRGTFTCHIAFPSQIGTPNLCWGHALWDLTSPGVVGSRTPGLQQEHCERQGFGLSVTQMRLHHTPRCTPGKQVEDVGLQSRGSALGELAGGQGASLLPAAKEASGVGVRGHRGGHRRQERSDPLQRGPSPNSTSARRPSGRLHPGGCPRLHPHPHPP